MKKKGFVKATAVMLACLSLSLAGCGGDGGGLRGSNKRLQIYLTASQYSKRTIEEMEDYYNDEVADGYTIKISLQSAGYDSSIGNILSTGSADIVELTDKYAKQYIIPDYLLPLDSYIDEGVLDISDMTPSAVNRFRLNAETGEVGEDQPLYAIPKDTQFVMMFYNKTAFEDCGINVVTIAEDSLDAYNEEHGSSYLPHGYYVYETNPDPSDTSLKQTTFNGVTGYHVFNDCIPMNWEEQLTLAKAFTPSYNQSSPTEYGYYSEWWFNYGWSVGGDCLENGAEGNLVFTLCDDTPNYLVTADTSVNGTQYKAGELLGYLDKLYVKENGTGTLPLYELPSQYDAFAEFCALSQEKGKAVTDDGSVKGYGVSPNPTRLGKTSRSAVLTTKMAAMVAADLSEVGSLRSAMGALKMEWGIAPLAQYREYNADGTLKTSENGTPIQGLAVTHNEQSALAICSKTKYADYCAEFIGWWTSEDAQARLVKTGDCVSCLNSFNAKPETMETLKASLGCANIEPVVSIAQTVMQGDWSYVEDGDWITEWSNDLNTKVRDGDKTIDAFWAEWEQPVTEYLAANYTTKKYR